jgi:hypothetical protein
LYLSLNITFGSKTLQFTQIFEIECGKNTSGFLLYYIYTFLKQFLLNFKYFKKLNFTKNAKYFSHILVVILHRSTKFEIYMLHSLRDIKKTNSKKYRGVDETLLRQNFSLI